MSFINMLHHGPWLSVDVLNSVVTPCRVLVCMGSRMKVSARSHDMCSHSLFFSLDSVPHQPLKTSHAAQDHHALDEVLGSSQEIGWMLSSRSTAGIRHLAEMRLKHSKLRKFDAEKWRPLPFLSIEINLCKSFGGLPLAKFESIGKPERV